MPKFNLLPLLALAACATHQARQTASEDPGMEYVEVCNPAPNCKKFSRLIMGTDHLVQANWTRDGQREATEAEAVRVLDEAAKLGINLFDTAPIYVGGVETKLGRWLHARAAAAANDNFYAAPGLNPDRKLYALSKGGFPFDLFYSRTLAPGMHSTELRTTLQREGILGIDGRNPALTDVPPGTYASRLFGDETQIAARVGEELGHSTANLPDGITIYLMHRDDGDFLRFNRLTRLQTAVPKIMAALSRPEIASKFWALGWSNWKAGRVNESLRAVTANPALVRPLFNSSYFSLFEMSLRPIHAGGVQVTHDEMKSANFEPGIFQNPYSPLGGFSVLDKPSPTWETAQAAAKQKHDAGDAYWQNVYPAIFTDANRARFERVVSFTADFNRAHNTTYTVDQMVNAYALAHKRTDFLTIGPVTVEQLRRTVASLKLARELTPADLDYLYSGRH